MRIDFDRICKLAGVNSERSRGYLNEGTHLEIEKEGSDLHGDDLYEEDSDLVSTEEGQGEMAYEDLDLHGEGLYEEEKEDQPEEDQPEESPEDEEVVEVNISELMSEIRRAKKIIKLNKSKQRSIQENKLKSVIAREVESVLAEISQSDYDSSWVYGKRKPRNSKKGYSARGSFIPGIGFRK
jgi:hypothetical protein